MNWPPEKPGEERGVSNYFNFIFVFLFTLEDAFFLIKQSSYLIHKIEYIRISISRDTMLKFSLLKAFPVQAKQH
jgi:hypothetical protein